MASNETFNLYILIRIYIIDFYINIQIYYLLYYTATVTIIKKCMQQHVKLSLWNFVKKKKN